MTYETFCELDNAYWQMWRDYSKMLRRGQFSCEAHLLEAEQDLESLRAQLEPYRKLYEPRAADDAAEAQPPSPN